MSGAWSGDDETRELGEPSGTGSAPTQPPRRHIFTGMATTRRPAPLPEAESTSLPTALPVAQPWAGAEATRPRREGSTAGDPAPASPATAPPTGRTTRITALLSADGRRGPLSGAVWPDYELGDLLGQGGMGAVYRARQISVDRLVALKVLPAHLAGDADLRRRFEIEARASSALASPHIVQVHHAGIHQGQLYFAMEFVAGQSLAELAKAKRAAGTWFPLTESLGYVAQLAEALRVAGAAGVVHRDIKPGNCMVTGDGTLKLADFGIAKILGEDGGTLTGTAMGTPSYLSPEQARGEAIDQRADLYSLGIMLYELATGRLPYAGGSPDALIYQHAFTEPPLPRSLNKDISADLQAVILKLIQKEPAARYADATALLTDLGRITGGMAPEVAVFVGRKLGTGADAALARIGGWRRRVWAAAAAVIVAGGALGGGWWWWDARATEAGRLRERLAALDSPQPVPDGADAALARLAALAGADDRDVTRWRADLERVGALQARLAALAGAERVDIPAAAAVLDALEQEIGKDSPQARQERERLAAARLDLAALRAELARLDAVDVVPAAEAAGLAPRLQRYQRLVPAGDADGGRWAAALARSQSVIAGLRQRLAALDGAVAPAALPALGAELQRLRILAGGEDADGVRWQRRHDEAAARIAALRASLRRLEGEALPGAELVAATAVDLAAWAAAAGEDDAELRRWRGAIAAAAQRRQGLAAELAGLADGAIAAPRLPALDEAVAEYRRLAGLDDADGRRWAGTLAAARARLALWQEQLAQLDTKAALSREDQELARAALAGLRDAAALDPALDERWTQRLARDAARIAQLARDLAVLDQAATPPAGAAQRLGEYIALAGADDARAVAWRGKLGRLDVLRGRLASLDQPRPLPETAAADLAALAGLVGDGDPQVATWRGKLLRCAALAAELAVLDRRQPPPAEAPVRLAAYEREVGPEAPDARRWRERLARVAALRERLADLPRRLLPAPSAAADCAALAGLIGAEAVAPLRRRLAEIAGPPAPWAAAEGEDAQGRWAAADLGGVRLRLRWIPCGTVTVGSPADEPGREADEAPVAIAITRGFWLGEREVSQAEWRALLGATPSLHRGDALPVERVSWEQAQAFCRALGERLGAAARLPSEAEWEHAARAGAAAATWSGPQGAAGAEALARLAVHAADAPQPCGTRLPNALGLHDLHGNVWEWCQDGYAPWPVRPATDHVGSGAQRVIRGGSWGDGPAQLRLANRHRVDPTMRSPYLGLRVLVEGGELPAPPRTAVYVVQPGDTLTRIAERLLGDQERWREIAAWNPGLEIARPLTVGLELQVEGTRP